MCNIFEWLYKLAKTVKTKVNRLCEHAFISVFFYIGDLNSKLV